MGQSSESTFYYKIIEKVDNKKVLRLSIALPLVSLATQGLNIFNEPPYICSHYWIHINLSSFFKMTVLISATIYRVIGIALIMKVSKTPWCPNCSILFFLFCFEHTKRDNKREREKRNANVR